MAKEDTNPSSDLRAGLLSGSDHPPPAQVQRLGIDDMLRLHAGEFGRWQLRHFVLTSVAWALEAFHTMVMIFADREPGWRCTFAGGCPSEPCGIPAAGWEWVEGFAASTVSEWGLICDQRYKVGLTQSAFFAGCMVGAGVFGHLSDSFLGRKGSLTIVCILNAISGILTSLSPNYWVYTGLRFLSGFGTGGVGLCAFVLATEPIGPSKRGVVGMSTFYFFSGGIAILSGLAYLFPTWRTLYVVTSIPSILFILLIIPFISESPRWYLIRRQTAKAMDIMSAIAHCNGRDIPPGITLKLDDEDDEENSKENSQIAESGSIILVLRSRITRLRLVLMVGINFVTSIVYYGLTLNVVNLKTNLYFNVALNSVAEMPAFLITAVLIDRLGRKPLGLGTMMLSGVSCSIGFFIGGAGVVMKTIRMVCGVIGIFGMAAVYNLLFIYTAELFPTVVRNAAMGCVTQASQLGAILAPLVVVTGESLPFAVFGGCAMVGALLTYYLPETMSKPLYDTMTGLEDGEVKCVK